MAKTIALIVMALIVAFAVAWVVFFHRVLRKYQKDGGFIMFPPGTGDVSQEEMRRLHAEYMKQPLWRRMLGLKSK